MNKKFKKFKKLSVLFFLQINEVPTQSNRNDLKLWISSNVIFHNFVSMLFAIFSIAILKLAILTLRYFNVRYFDSFDIVAGKHTSCSSLFLISSIQTFNIFRIDNAVIQSTSFWIYFFEQIDVRINKFRERFTRLSDLSNTKKSNNYSFFIFAFALKKFQNVYL